MPITSSRGVPWSTTRIGGTRMPSPKWSVAPTSNEPGTRPAHVGPVPVGLRERDQLAVGEHGPDELKSGKCVPPR